MVVRSRTLILCVLALSIPLLPGLGMNLAGAQSGEKLVIYSGRSESLMGPLFAKFSEETSVQVEVRYGSTAEMAATILEEGQNSPADVYIAQDAGALGALAVEGRLTRLPSDILERVAPRFRSDSGMWVGISGRARVLVYNSDQVKPEELPESILGLTEPAWKGRVGWAPSNGSLQAQVTAMRALLGEEKTRAWLEGMVANEAKVYPSNDAILQAIGAGEIAVGLVNHYYLLEFKAQTPSLPAAIHYFPKGDLGSLINVAGTGIVNTSQQPGLAQRLILYLLGKDAQTYFAQTTFEYPLIEGVPVNEALRPLAEIEAPQIDLSQLSDLRGTLDLLRSTGALP